MNTTLYKRRRGEEEEEEKSSLKEMKKNENRVEEEGRKQMINIRLETRKWQNCDCTKHLGAKSSSLLSQG